MKTFLSISFIALTLGIILSIFYLRLDGQDQNPVPPDRSATLSGRPQLLVHNAQHEEITQKIETVEWAGATFERLKSKIDPLLKRVEEKPDWLVSRLAMNWDTHYIRAITEKSKTIGGEGKAPIPTPRFAGSRDWATGFSRPSLEKLRPYNDQNGKIWLINSKTKQEEWVEPRLTGHHIEKINMNIMQLAADASFLYWITGEKKYAELAAPVLWTYMHGFSYVEPPIIRDHSKSNSSKIIGSNTFEVIHEGIMLHVAVAYDFLYDYIIAQEEMDGKIIEEGLKIMADRVIAGGGREGNWNLHQAREITYAALALNSDDTYKDGKGRQYYVDIVLNADLPSQKGLLQVIHEGYDQESAIWPEAAGYAFDTTANIIEIASLLASVPEGREALSHPILGQAVLNQSYLTHPNGWSTAVGDTRYTRVDTRALELMVAQANLSGNLELAKSLAAVLRAEIDSGYYNRSRQSKALALIRYLSELPKIDQQALKQAPTYFAEPLNILMLRNLSESGNPSQALSVAMFGTKGGHMHRNGLAIELYGRGHVLGVDPGRGSSYWQPDHRQYYYAPPSHNTVIVNGVSTYSTKPDKAIQLEIKAVEPALGSTGSNPHLTYATASFEHQKPKAEQERTLALVRIDDDTAFYLDIFRSRSKSGEEYHDWFYHGMADTIQVNDIEGQPLELKSSELLTSEAGNLVGYDYFENEASLETALTTRTTFPLEVKGKQIAMDLWMIGEKGRQIFTVTAPKNLSSGNAFPKDIRSQPCPTLVVRQNGSAWNQPFVAVYEPYEKSNGAQIKQVEETGDGTWRITGEDWTAELTLSQFKLDVQIKKTAKASAQ